MLRTVNSNTWTVSQSPYLLTLFKCASAKSNLDKTDVNPSVANTICAKTVSFVDIVTTRNQNPYKANLGKLQRGRMCDGNGQVPDIISYCGHAYKTRWLRYRVGLLDGGTSSIQV